MQNTNRSHGAFAALLIAASVALASCIETSPTDPNVLSVASPHMRVMVPCTGSVSQKTISCENGSVPSLSGLKGEIVGNQNVDVKLTSSNVSYNSSTGTFQFDVTVQNLMKPAMGTPGGSLPDSDGIRVFFNSGPTVTSGTGVISVANPDGYASITGASQPYFRYNEILGTNAVSSAKTWQLNVPSTATTFAFNLYIDTDCEIPLVINEVLVNPGGTITDANGEWLELYNAGSHPVDLQGLVMADSAASGRRPYFLISSSVVVQPGGYVTLGNTTNTTNNGGVPVDYAYGASMALANSLDAVKLSRVYGTDTITIDRIQYSNASVSAQNGISRELKNPALANENMDGSNWADASVTAVYGPGGRGTPNAENSTFVAAVTASLARFAAILTSPLRL